MHIKVTLYYSKSTKGCHVFKTDGTEEPSVTNLYIRRAAFDKDEAPKSVTVEVEG